MKHRIANVFKKWTLTVSIVLLLISFLGIFKEVMAVDKVTVQLGWYHQAQFAGYYAADQLGYYADEGLEVSLLPRPAPDTNVVAQVLNGTADLGMDVGTSPLIARSQHPIVAFATIYRRSPQVYMTLSESGITRPHDFPGHTIRVLSYGDALIFQALMTRLELDPDSVRQIETGYDPAPFFANTVDIWPSYLTNEILIADKQGYQVNIILPNDYGIHVYGDTLFTTDQLIREHPDRALRFLRATLRGWRWAIEHPEEAGSLVLKYDPTLDQAHQVAVIEASIPLIHTGKDQIGWMRPDIWQGMSDMLMKQGILKRPVDVDTMYTLEFLHTIYRREQ